MPACSRRSPASCIAPGSVRIHRWIARENEHPSTGSHRRPKHCPRRRSRPGRAPARDLGPSVSGASGARPCTRAPESTNDTAVVARAARHRLARRWSSPDPLSPIHRHIVRSSGSLYVLCPRGNSRAGIRPPERRSWPDIPASSHRGRACLAYPSARRARRRARAWVTGRPAACAGPREPREVHRARRRTNESSERLPSGAPLVVAVLRPRAHRTHHGA